MFFNQNTILNCFKGNMRINILKAKIQQSTFYKAIRLDAKPQRGVFYSSHFGIIGISLLVGFNSSEWLKVLIAYTGAEVVTLLLLYLSALLVTWNDKEKVKVLHREPLKDEHGN